MSNIAFHFFLCALTKFRLLTKTDHRVFYADMNTHHSLFLFFLLIKTNLIIIIELFRCSLNKRKALPLVISIA